jgi:hypothetical protein
MNHPDPTIQWNHPSLKGNFYVLVSQKVYSLKEVLILLLGGVAGIEDV